MQEAYRRVVAAVDGLVPHPLVAVGREEIVNITFEYRDPTLAHCSIAVFINGKNVGTLRLGQEDVVGFTQIVQQGCSATVLWYSGDQGGATPFWVVGRRSRRPSMSEVYQFQDLDGTHTLTRAELLAEYFPYWAEEMRQAGKEADISEDKCIEDWIAGHWALEDK